MNIDPLKLQTKGWSKEEIEHAKRIFRKAEKNKNRKIKIFEQITYIILVLGVLAISFTGAALIEPFLLFVKPLPALGIIFILGIIFGGIISALVKHIEKIELHHHLIISLIVPTSAIITSILIVREAKIINTNMEHNPLLLGIIYSIGCLIPFGILIWLQRIEDETH